MSRSGSIPGLPRPHTTIRAPRCTLRFYRGDCLEVMSALPAGQVSAIVTSPPYNLGIRYRSFKDTMPRGQYLEWSDEWIGAARRVLEPHGSLFLNVGAKPTDPWPALDVAQAARRHLQLQNTIHWIKSIAIDKLAAGATGDVSVGHYKPINSDRFVNDCHEFVFHFTPEGKTPLDRTAIGVPYQDASNVARWASGGGNRRCRGNTWFIPYQTIQSRDKDRPHPATFPPRLPEYLLQAARLVQGQARHGPLPGPRQQRRRRRSARSRFHRHRGGRALSDGSDHPRQERHRAMIGAVFRRTFVTAAGVKSQPSPILVLLGPFSGVPMNKLLKRLAATALVVLLPALATAQTAATGNVEGVVTDPSGAVLPGVTVVVRNLGTNATRQAITDEGGRYRATALQPGTYEVTATLSGFDAQPLTDIPVLVGQTIAIDIRMRTAGVTETVTVTGESPMIDTNRTDVSNVVGEKAIENLPINGRRWENFVLLGPAVTNDGNFGLVSYRGISGLYNNNTVDGADNNQAFFSEARGRTRTSYSISQASIKEFQVGISNFSAEFGRAAGGTVNAVTKSGTNNYRGEGFYFIRDDAFQEKDPFIPFKPDERRQQFGVSTGGPIKRDKIFFFANFDQQLRDFPYFVRPAQTSFLPPVAACTVPGCAATVAFYESLGASYPREGNNKIGLGKVDVAINPSNNLTLQYNAHRWDSPNGVQTQPVISVSPSANGSDIVKTDFALATLNSVLSARWLNEVRVQIGRDFEAQLPNSPIGPGTTVTGGIDIGIPNFLPRTKYPDERRYQFVDNITFYAGAHSVKGGFDINYVQESLINLFQGEGIYAFPNINAIASDCPIGATGCTPLITGAANDLRHYTSFNQQFDLRGGGLNGEVEFQTTDYNFFIQDTWRVNNQLTLNLGLRYEYQQLPQPTETEVEGVAFTGNPAYPATVTFHQDKNNWGPRVGFSYDINGAHKTVIRGGWGLYYGRSSNSLISAALTNNAATFGAYNLTPTTGGPQYPSVFDAPPPLASARPSIQYLSPTIERPQINMAELTLDQALGSNITVSASYLYSRGTHLPTFVDTNLPESNATVEYFVDGQSQGTFPFFRGTRPDGNINNAIEVADIVDSTYNALVLQANKRFSGGLLFSANYTLSKSEDTGQNSTTFISNFASQVNPFDNEAEKGPSSFDRRHRAVISGHYAPDFLWGFQIGGSGTFESGLPLTPTISINAGALNNTGVVSTQSVNGTGASNRVPFEERNSFRQDGRKSIDMRVSKAFNIGGRRQIVALWEAFNVFNWTNYTVYGATKYRATSSSFDAATNRAVVNFTADPGFGNPTSASNTLSAMRDMQLGFKFLW